jgi:hypothetical protein
MATGIMRAPFTPRAPARRPVVAQVPKNTVRPTSAVRATAAARMPEGSARRAAIMDVLEEHLLPYGLSANQVGELRRILSLIFAGPAVAVPGFMPRPGGQPFGGARPGFTPRR